MIDEDIATELRGKYSEWNTWQAVIDAGWIDEGSQNAWVACEWCGTLCYRALTNLHRTTCRGSLALSVPNPVPQNLIDEYELDSPPPPKEAEKPPKV